MREENRVRKINVWKYLTLILAAILTVLLLLGWVTAVRWRMEAHNALRQGRNIWMALRMTGIEYYGRGTSMYDDDRTSGLEEAAEQQVLKLVEYEGSVSVLKHRGNMQLPTEMLYHEGPYLVYYYEGDDSSRNWEVYRAHDLFNLSTAAWTEKET